MVSKQAVLELSWLVEAKMTAIVFIVGIIAALACAGYRFRLLRIALNLVPVAIGAGYAAHFILIGRPTWAVIVALVSLYVTCPWWEFLDEAVWMEIGVCRKC
jgi:hypothetical protein